MNITVLRETQADEDRVALTPDSVKKLIQAGAAIRVEGGAGAAAGARDVNYEEAGAAVTDDRAALLSGADILAAVNRPGPDDIAGLKPGAIVIGFLRPLDDPNGLLSYMDRGLTAFSMELVPRTTRAQSMDALSSQANIAGYKAVVLAADRLPRIFPMMMTAAGTVAPARVLVLGAGVAGLQAIGTARRLGAVVESFDVRPEAGEAVRSLGATFLEVDLSGVQTQGAGGYAVELAEEMMERSRALVVRRAAAADIIITTAQIPGKRAPLLVTREAVEGMKRGSVIVDLAASTGGNCELTRPGEEIAWGGVEIVAPLNLAARVAVHASQLYSNNLTAFLKLLVRDGALHLDLEDDILGPSCVFHEGRIANPRVEALLSSPAPAAAGGEERGKVR